MAKIKNVVFDLGGVVVKWDPVQVLGSFHGDACIVNYIKTRGFFVDEWKYFDKGTLNREQLVEKVSARIGCSPESCHAFIDHVKYSLDPLVETEQLIRELSGRGFKLYCLSNMSVEFYDYLKTREVFRYFDGQIISAHEHMVKPDREIFELLLNRFHLQAAETLFIDDLPANVEAAREVGLQAIRFFNNPDTYRLIRGQLR